MRRIEILIKSCSYPSGDIWYTRCKRLRYPPFYITFEPFSLPLRPEITDFRLSWPDLELLRLVNPLPGSYSPVITPHSRGVVLIQRVETKGPDIPARLTRVHSGRRVYPPLFLAGLPEPIAWVDHLLALWKCLLASREKIFQIESIGIYLRLGYPRAQCGFAHLPSTTPLDDAGGQCERADSDLALSPASGRTQTPSTLRI